MALWLPEGGYQVTLLSGGAVRAASFVQVALDGPNEFALTARD